MPDAFVTGGSGFIGGALLEALRAEGRDVLALARTDDAASLVTARGGRPVRGDLSAPDEWVPALRGCRTLFHAAGRVLMCPRDRSVLREVNVEGARSAVRAAAAAGIERVVLTSSAAAIGERPGEIGTEDSAHSGGYPSAYARSKHLGELAAFEEAERLGVELVSVNPSSVQGPGRLAGTGRLFQAFAEGRARVAVRTSASLVFLDDCVRGHLAAERLGTPGERYLLSGWSGPVEDLIDVLGEVAGHRRRVRYVPMWAASAAAVVVEWLWRLGRSSPPLCRDMVRTARHGHLFDGSRAERDLGVTYTPLRDWLAETVAWYQRLKPEG